MLFLIKQRRSSLLSQLGMSPGSTAVENGDAYTDCRKMRELYQMAYVLCGDGLAAGLPVETLCDVYFPNPLPEVKLGDDDCEKTGEELLQQFLPTMRKGRARRSFETSGDFEAGDDVDYDDDRSSDGLSFVGDENADLTIKATVSDPRRGIKLFIGKKSKSRLSEAESQDSETEVNKTPPRLSAFKKKTLPSLEDAFERTKMRSKSIQFVFCYAGRIQRCKSTERRKSSVAESPPALPVFPVFPVSQSSRFHKLCLSLPPSGKGKALTGKAKNKTIRNRLLPQSLLYSLL